MLESLELEGAQGLQVLVQRLLDEGTGSDVLVDDLEQIRGLVAEEVEETVLDVMDRLVGWCAPGARLVPRPGAPGAAGSGTSGGE